MNKIKDNGIYILTGVLLMGIMLAFDLATPIGFADGTLYAGLILFTLFFKEGIYTLLAGVAATILIGIGYYYSARGIGASTASLTNRSLSVLLAWTVVALIYFYKGSKKESQFYKERIGALVAHAEEGIIIVSDDGTTVMANLKMMDMFGFREEELRGEKFGYILPTIMTQDDKGEPKMFSPDNLSPFLGKEIIFQARKKNEQTFLANVHIWNFEFSRDKYYVFYILDITEKIEHKEAIEQAHNELLLYSAELKNLNSQLEDRIGDRTDKLNKAVEDLKLTNYLLQREIMHKEEALSALKESQRMLETIAENFPNGILYVLNREFRILFAHGQEIKNLGFSSKDLIGKLFLPLEEELTAAEVRGLLSKVLSGEIISFEYHSLVNDNYYLFNMAPLVNEENEATQILSVSQNITSMKRAELEIRKSFERERELNEMKSRFVSTASHEFRTPLTAILSSASLIALYKSTKDEPQRQKHIKRINSSVANLTEILNDFLSLGKLEEGKVRNQPVEFDIRELCEDIRDETGALVKPGQEVILTYRLEETVAFLDIQLVRNIIINLLSNAIKYSPEGSVIELDAVKEGGLLLFSIKDKGIGIPEEDKKHLFETFFRARNVETIKGTGMGLHIVKKYLSLMDGDINFESTLNEGSKFTVKWKV